MAYACDRCGTLRADDGDCRVCGGSSSVSEYDMSGSGDGDQYVCDECDRVFDSKQGLRNHERTHESDD